MKIALVLILAAAPAFAQSGTSPLGDGGSGTTTGTTTGVFHLSPLTEQNVMISPGGKVVLRIDPKGAIFWKGREVKGNREFRRAILDVRKALMEGCRQ